MSAKNYSILQFKRDQYLEVVHQDTYMDNLPKIK